eukprot:10082538-Alexandrium_andersonii.AAC.1
MEEVRNEARAIFRLAQDKTAWLKAAAAATRRGSSTAEGPFQPSKAFQAARWLGLLPAGEGGLVEDSLCHADPE